MLARFKAGIRSLAGHNPPGRNLVVFPDDSFLVGYPKSGNTWSRFLVANLLYPNRNPNWANIDELVPSPEVMSKRHFERMQRPRVIWGVHDSFNARYKQVIYIVRDPRDVALSQYAHHRKRKLIEDGHPFAEFLERFLAGETNEHGSWKHNVASWIAARYGDPGFLLVRYEDMISAPEQELGRIAGFLGVKTTSHDLAKAVEQSSPDRMRRLEQEGAEKCALTKNTRLDLPFVRTAKAGNWRSDLPEDSIALIENAWGQWMKWFGYSLVTREEADIKAFDLVTR
jgi:hypothetical protein